MTFRKLTSSLWHLSTWRPALASRPYAIRCRPGAEAKRPVFQVLVVLEPKQDVDYLNNYVSDKKNTSQKSCDLYRIIIVTYFVSYIRKTRISYILSGFVVFNLEIHNKSVFTERNL